MRKGLNLPAVVTVLLLLFGLISSAGAQAISSSQASPSGRYIIVLEEGAAPSRTAREHGLAIARLYSTALNGFAAVVPEGRLASLRADPRVRILEPDQVVQAAPKSPGKGGKGKPPAPQPSQVLPTGVDRIDAEHNDNEGAGIKVAIIDTGISLKHPDLRVVGNVNFVNPRKSGNDDNGHGSHVAGIVAALNNSIGVRGVAPEVDLYAVKVLDASGRGWMSDVIAGVNWAVANGMDVANMSLTASGTSDALHQAIINATAQGVSFVVAAGNNAADADNYIPAAYDEVITVSAIADSDGLGGHLGPNTSYGADDTFATFSNYGQGVDIAAPGVDIYSTWKGNDYSTISGTSMATPHVAGAAALYIESQRALGLDPTPAEVRTALIASGTAQTDPNGFGGDTDGYPEPLLNASAL